MLYFFDTSGQYIGCREQNKDEPKPVNATYLPPNPSKGYGARLIDGKWQQYLLPTDNVIGTLKPTETELLRVEIADLKARLAKVEAVPIVKTALEPVAEKTIT